MITKIIPIDEVVVTIVVLLLAGGGGGCVVLVAEWAGEAGATLLLPNRLFIPNVRGGFGGTGSTFKNKHTKI